MDKVGGFIEEVDFEGNDGVRCMGEIYEDQVHLCGFN